MSIFIRTYRVQLRSLLCWLSLCLASGGAVAAKPPLVVDSVNAVWLAASFGGKELAQAVANFKGATRVTVAIACSTNDHPTGFMARMVALFNDFTSKKAGESNSLLIALRWKNAVAGGYYIDSISVTPNLIGGLFPDSALRTFFRTVEGIREDRGAVVLKAEVTSAKKMVTALQKLQKQVNGVTVTQEQLQEVFPSVSPEVVAAINQYSVEFGITTPDRMANFLGQIGAETGGLQLLNESCSYSAVQIYNIFLKRALLSSAASTTGKTFKYCDLMEGISCTEFTSCPGKNKGHSGCDSTISVPCSAGEECTWDYASLLKADSTRGAYAIKASYVSSSTLFDYTYGCRMGNGAKSTQDGSTYAGKGFIHLTGKDQYKAISDKWNTLYPGDKKEFHGKDISLLETDVEVAMKASMIYWDMNGLNNLADEGTAPSNINEIGKKVNGQNPPNGEQQRKDYTIRIFQQLNK